MKAFLRTHRLLPLATVVLLVGLLGLVSQRLGLVHAATTVPVTSCPDEATLFADIVAAGPGGTVRFNISSPCTIPITAPLTIPFDLTLDNVGQRVTLDGGGTTQVLVVPTVGTTLTLNALTVANGNSTTNGGGLENHGTVNINNSTFDHNRATVTGGGLANFGTANISNSTFADNITIAGAGGGLANFGTANISNSTFAKNSTAIFNSTGTLRIAQSIVANNGINCLNSAGTITDQGYNLSNDSSCPFTDPTSRQNTNPLLDPAGLADNGGPTRTIALLPGSPAIDVIPAPSVCKLTTDQRGFPRPDNTESVCDIGAYEFQDPPSPSAPSVPPCQVNIGPVQGQANGGQASGQANSTANSTSSSQSSQQSGIDVSTLLKKLGQAGSGTLSNTVGVTNQNTSTSTNTNQATSDSKSSATGGNASAQTGPITIPC